MKTLWSLRLLAGRLGCWWAGHNDHPIYLPFGERGAAQRVGWWCPRCGDGDVEVEV